MPVADAPATHPPMHRALASWYGPGLYGNKMACGGTLSTTTLGVAHKTLRCGTRIRICFRRCATVRVVDRGPYVGGREFDLTSATKNRVRFPNGVAYVRYKIKGRK